MLYEIRLCAVQPGRMADVEQRMLSDVPPLFAARGVRSVALRCCMRWRVHGCGICHEEDALCSM